jgi:hypothetical protein
MSARTANPKLAKVAAKQQDKTPKIAPAHSETQQGTDLHAVLHLQQTVGNRAVSRLIQAKLTVGPAGDRYEQEADRVAQQVTAMSASIMPAPAAQQPALQRAPDEEDELQMKPLVASITPLVQRAAAPEEEEIQTKSLVQRAAEEEDELQMKPLLQRAPIEEEEVQTKSIVQRAAEEEEEELQAKPAVQRAAGGAGFEVSGNFEQQLPATVRNFMEPRFGTDFSGVRIHTGSQSAQLNRSVSAQAFTLGQDIYLGEGKDDVESSAGKSLLAHELTHVVQQTGSYQVQRQVTGVIQRVWANTVEHAKSIRDNIRLYEDRLDHIIEEHALSGGEGRDRIGRFNTDNRETIRNYVLATIKSGTPKLGPRSAYDFECDFTGPIGTDDAGAESKRVRVVVTQATQKNDNVGKVQTAYPI